VNWRLRSGSSSTTSRRTLASKGELHNLRHEDEPSRREPSMNGTNAAPYFFFMISYALGQSYHAGVFRGGAYRRPLIRGRFARMCCRIAVPARRAPTDLEMAQ